MAKPNYDKYKKMFESSQLLSPESPAEVIANLAHRAQLGFTGQFLSWDSDDLKAYRAQ